MFKRILKKDLKRRISINIIIFLFITFATALIASSVNNIIVITSGLDYYKNISKVPEIVAFTAGESEKDEMIDFLEDCKYADEYYYGKLVYIKTSNIWIDSKKMKSNDAFYFGKNEDQTLVSFDLEGNKLQLKGNEIAVPKTVMKDQKLHVNDKIKIKFHDEIIEFTIRYSMQDAVFGAEMNNTRRLLVSDEMFDKFYDQATGDQEIMGYIGIETSQEKEFLKEWNSQNFVTNVNTIGESMFDLMYVYDKITAALAIAVGAGFVLVSFMVIRFTLTFTVEDEYREIGIMKAIGLKNLDIKKVYLIKYITIVILASVSGLLISYPMSEILVSRASENILMKNTSANFMINIICAFVMAGIVMLFTYSSMRKVNKISAVTAIHYGNNGERYQAKSLLKLHKSKWSVPVFLGINDVLCSLKRFAILIITLSISFSMMSLILNTLNTFESKEMAEKFDVNTESSIYISELSGQESNVYDSNVLMNEVYKIEKKLKDIGYDADISPVAMYFLTLQTEEFNTEKIVSLQVLGKNNDYLRVSKGKTPMLENEIAVSEIIMDMYGFEIGDYVTSEINGERKEFIITGTFTDYMQTGKSIRLSPAFDNTDLPIYFFTCMNVDIKNTDKTQDELKVELSKKIPEIRWSTAQDIVDTGVSGIKESLTAFKDMLMIGLSFMIMMITYLMNKLFVVREKGEIAMMKSIGFKNKDIRNYQMARMVFTGILAMLISIPLSMLSDHFILVNIFKIMGAELNIQVNAFEAYLLYPGILLITMLIATYVVTLGNKKINIRELNNLE